jgi:integration host factor subunit beta
LNSVSGRQNRSRSDTIAENFRGRVTLACTTKTSAQDDREQTMVRSELIEILSSKADLRHAQSEEVVDLFFGEIAHALTTEGRVEIRGFGAFTVRRYQGYAGRNPKTGEPLTVPEKKLPFWKTGLELRQRVDSLELIASRP